MKTDAVYRSLVQWQNAVKLCEELAQQARREILVLNGDLRTREGRAAKAAYRVGRERKEGPKMERDMIREIWDDPGHQ